MAKAREASEKISNFPGLGDTTLDIIDGAIKSDLPVYLHCLGGIGRTGTVVGCWLVRHGIAGGEAALDCIRKLRRNDTHARISSPETAHQRRFICEWKEGE